MSGIFNILNTANTGLRASQTALQTVGHNIANANTEGYSRQRVELKAEKAYSLGGIGQLGQGVTMEAITRTVDDYVTKQIRGENGTFNKFNAKSEILSQMEIIFNEPSDTSLNFNLGEMFDAWTELSKNPEMLTSKSIVVEKSKVVATTLNHMATQLEGLENNTIELIEMDAKNFNSIVQSLDSLNKQIFNTSIKGLIPNDLLDQRDLLLKGLSGIAGFEADFSDKYGRVKIIVDGQEVLDTEGVQYTIYVKDIIDGDPTSGKTGDIQLKSTKTTDSIDHIPLSGRIAGYKDALSEIEDQIVALNDFAKILANTINSVHSTGDSGQDVFTWEDGNVSAAGIQVNKELDIDNNKVNAGTGDNPAEGDGSLALKIAGLRNEKAVFLNGDNTIEGAYNMMVTNIGISKQQSDNMVANQEVLLNQLVMRRESTAGVNIDEEVTDLIKFQKSYEANARVIQVLAEMLDVLINRTGV